MAQPKPAIPAQMQSGTQSGMRLLETSVRELLRTGTIDAEEAAHFGVQPASRRPAVAGQP